MDHCCFRCHFIRVDDLHKFIPNTIIQWVEIGTIWVCHCDHNKINAAAVTKSNISLNSLQYLYHIKIQEYYLQRYTKDIFSEYKKERKEYTWRYENAINIGTISAFIAFLETLFLHFSSLFIHFLPLQLFDENKYNTHKYWPCL